MAACEAVWLKRILKDLGVPIKDLIPVYRDNMSNPVFHAWTKHIEVHYHFIRERVLAGDVDLQHISTYLQTADIFTKALGAVGKHVPPDGTGWNRMQDVENRLITALLRGYSSLLRCAVTTRYCVVSSVLPLKLGRSGIVNPRSVMNCHNLSAPKAFVKMSAV